MVKRDGKKRKLGYWFGGNELPHGDGRRVRKGATLKVKPPIKLCSRGLHYSKHPCDAWEYAGTNQLWLVEDVGETLTGDDKCCTTARKHLAKIDAEPIVAAWIEWADNFSEGIDQERRKFKRMIDAEFRRIGAL